MTSSEFVQRLLAKGIQCVQHQACQGCKALVEFSREELVFPAGPVKPTLTDTELGKHHLFGECDLGFPQHWKGWNNATPIKPCPKPTNDNLYFRCIGKID